MNSRQVASLVLAALAGVAIAGCTRSRTARDAAAPVASPSPTATPSLVITRPEAGTAVGAPLTVAGELTAAGERTLAAVVYLREADGALQWRGNGPLTLRGATFTGTVSYTLDAAAPGVIEVMVIDPVTGTVLDRRSVSVELKPAP
jgi:hypothetical protein